MFKRFLRLTAVGCALALLAAGSTGAWAKGQVQPQYGWGVQPVQYQTYGRQAPQPYPQPNPPQAQPYPYPQPQPYPPQAQPYPYPQPQPYPPQPYTRVFPNPEINGLPVDICVSKFQDCDGEAATAFCRQQGFAYAVDNSTAVFPKTAHVYGGVCKPELFKVCGGYTRITCSN